MVAAEIAIVISHCSLAAGQPINGNPQKVVTRCQESINQGDLLCSTIVTMDVFYLEG